MKKIFLITPVAIFLAAGCAKKVERPDIIYIITDQQSAKMMSCAGNEYVNTPAMDYIAHNGIRFTRAYATNPVCSPSRVSMITGRFPGYFHDKKGDQVRQNASSMRIPEVSEKVKSTTIAAFLKKAGYDLVYGGKQHLPPSLSPDSLGFKILTNNQRGILAQKAADFIKSKHEKPYFMMVSFINPHDICFMAIRDFADSSSLKRLQKYSQTELNHLDEALEMPPGVSKEEFFAKYCPPLPPNHQVQKDEAKAINYFLTKDPRSFRIKARNEYTDEQWRMHRWAYARLTEMADAHVQVILDALKKSGREKNTLVIFSSDHGENDSSHKLEHKNVLYEESVNIPFAAMWKGHIPAGQVDSTDLVSNGLDLLPTVCDYAGVNGQADPRGRSLKPLFEGKKVDWRKYLGAESEISRMIISQDGLKYIRYDAVGTEERLMDLNKDPYEETHVTFDPSYKDQLNHLRNVFDEWFPDVK